MTKDERINEAWRLMLNALAYLIAAFGCLVIAVIHLFADRSGWALVMGALSAGLLYLSTLLKTESLRTFPEPEDDDE